MRGAETTHSSKFCFLSRVLTQHWLAHALQHEDLGRIVDPLLLLLLHPITARVSIHYLYALLGTKMSTKPAATQGTETPANNVKNIKKENGVTAAGRQNNKIVIRKPEHSSGNSRGSDGSKSASPSRPNKAEHSTDTDGDGAEADDENEENEPKKDGV